MISPLDRTSVDIRETTFASGHLIHRAHFTGGNVIRVPDIIFVELCCDRFIEPIAARVRFAGSHFVGTCEPKQHQRNTDHHAFDAAEAGDDAKDADAKGDDCENAVESFCQDHVHAPRWGMILGQAGRRLAGHDHRRGNVLKRIRDWLGYDWRLSSHQENIAETTSKIQCLMGSGGEAVIAVDVGQTTGSRRRENGTLGAHYKRGTLQSLVYNQFLKVVLESIKLSPAAVWVVVALSISAAAQDQSPKQGAQDAAGVATDLMQSTIKDTVNIEDIVPGFETADPDELTQHYEDKGADLETATQDALADFDNRSGEAGSLIVDTYSTRPDISVTRTESFLATARGALQSPESLTEGMFSVNQAPSCEPTEVNAVAPGIRSCDIYTNTDELQCTIGQIVEVDAEKSYRCVRETASYLKTCPETLQVQCLEPVANCRLEDGLLTTAFPDLELLNVNGLHRLQITGVDGFNGGSDTITRRARLIISDIDKVTSFRLSNVDYRTALSLRLNGTPVYSGPMGDGVSPLVYDEFFQGEIGDGSGEYIWGILQGANYLGAGAGLPPVETTVGLDLIDLLVEGENVIEFDLIVIGTANGRAGIEFTILLSCCANWDAQWVRQCP